MPYMKWGAKRPRNKPVYGRMWSKVPLRPLRRPTTIWQYVRARQSRAMGPMLKRRYTRVSFYKRRRYYR
jgi:hypothetical protein